MNTNAWGRNRPGVSYVFEVYEYVIYKKNKKYVNALDICSKVRVCHSNMFRFNFK